MVLQNPPLGLCFEHMKKNKHAVALGLIKSDKKTKAARENGKKGGRPRNMPTILEIVTHTGKGLIW